MAREKAAHDGGGAEAVGAVACRFLTARAGPARVAGLGRAAASLPSRPGSRPHRRGPEVHQAV